MSQKNEHIVPPEVAELMSRFMPDRVTLVERLYLKQLEVNPKNPRRFSLALAREDASIISGMPIFHCGTCLEKILAEALRTIFSEPNHTVEPIEIAHQLARVISHGNQPHEIPSDPDKDI